MSQSCEKPLHCSRTRNYGEHSAWSESVRWGIAVRYPVYGPKHRRSTDRSADLIVAEHRRFAEIRGLENLEVWFFTKLARKTTSGSVFSFHFWIQRLRFDRKGHRYWWGVQMTFWDIWGQILIHLKIIQMSYVHFGIKTFVAFCRHTCLLPSLQKMVIFLWKLKHWKIFKISPTQKKIPKNAVFSAKWRR